MAESALPNAPSSPHAARWRHPARSATWSPTSDADRVLVGYLDTSALVPLLASEPTSTACRRFWDDADTVVSSRLSYVEAAAALAQAHRTGRLTLTQHAVSLTRLGELWDQINVVEIDDVLIRHAAELAARFGLRGYDAIHRASAEQLIDQDLVAAAGDGQLLDAWNGLGVATVDPTSSGVEQ